MVFVLPNIIIAQITLDPLLDNDKEWFVERFVNSVMASYKDKTFVVIYNDDLQIVTNDDEGYKIKEEIVTSGANQEFQNYVNNYNEEGFKAVKIIYDALSIGALLYRLIGDTIYLGQLFILPEYQKKGIATEVINVLLPKKHPSYNVYEVLTRHQNIEALKFYKKLGFKVDKIEMVTKYEYDPLQYLPLIKKVA